MKDLKFFIVAALLVVFICGQTVNLSKIFPAQTLSTLGPEYNDPSFIKLIDNYFGCKTWDQGNCVECSQGYIFNKIGICCEIDPYCQQFNSAVGICEVCYQGYSVSSNGSCTTTPANSSNIGCSVWKNGSCSACSVRYFFNQNKVCTPVSDSCREWNTKGECTSCYWGYQVSNGTCVVSPAPTTTSTSANPLCSNWNHTVCLSCAFRAYFNNAGICTAVNDNCNTWDKHNGACLSCYTGYDLLNKLCVIASSNNIQNPTPSVPSSPSTVQGCKTFKDGQCKECANYWVLNPSGGCSVVSDLCRTYDNSGNCLTCYVGYEIKNGSCVYSQSNNAKPSDGGCQYWDWNNSICLKCSTNWVFDANKLCVPVNDQCRTHDKDGVCTGCYKGYDLLNGACVRSTCDNGTSATIDLGCKIWDWDNKKCVTCSYFWYFFNGSCAQVSPQCKTYDNVSGACLSCYDGYTLTNGACNISPVSVNISTSDDGCKTWANGVCKECYDHYAFNPSGVCTAVSDQCKKNSGLSCTSCYNGYVLVNGSCVISSQKSQQSTPSDAGCNVWDWNKQVCLSCSPYWYFSNGVCTIVSSLCKTYDNTTGACLSCFMGYTLKNGSCVISPSAASSSSVSDAGCSRWDENSHVCLQCSPYWVKINGACQTVSAYCKTYDDSGACTSCYSGYALSKGACSVTSTLCKTQDVKGLCLTCYTGYALYQGQCVTTSSLANIALYYAACCPEKLAQLRAEGRIPK